MSQTIELGLDTFGDVTVAADGRPLSQAQVLRNVVEEAVLADQVGPRLLRRRRASSRGLLGLGAGSRAGGDRRADDAHPSRVGGDGAEHRRSRPRLPALLDAQRDLERPRRSDRRPRLVHRVVSAVRVTTWRTTRSCSRRSCNLFAELLKRQPVTWSGRLRAPLDESDRVSADRDRARCARGSASAAARSRSCARRTTACR